MLSFYVALILGSLAYGFGFGYFAPYLLLPFAAPPAILAVLIIWALPKSDNAPVQFLPPLFICFFCALSLWPNYLAISLPGLPWLTMLRLFGLPLALVLLVCVSVSASFRREISDTLQADPFIWRAFLAFVIIQTLSIGLSSAIGATVNRYIVAQTNWTAIFFVSCYLFRREGFAELWAKLLLFMALALCPIAIWESRLGHVPWAGHIPSFLKIEDEAVLRTLAGAARAATGIHRVTTIQSTPLGLAEFLGLTAPFAIHFMLNRYKLLLRLVSGLYIPLSLYCIILTDSRLGIVAFFVSVLVYLLIWALLGWRQKKGSIIAPAIVLAYPVIFCAAITATFFVGRLRKAIWGGGAQQPSTEARKEQWEMAIPKIIHNPFGHGVSRAAHTLGFYSDDILTIDSYFLSVLLDYGVLGFIIYYFIFGRAAWVGARSLLSAPEERELKLLLPMAVSLVAFIAIKSVFSQEDNHPLVFMMVAAILALSRRAARAAPPMASRYPKAPSPRAKAKA